MAKNYYNSRIELARKRTSDLHQQVGTLSSYFAGLEQQLIETLSKCINPANPQRAKIALSQLSFRQCSTAFSQTVSNSCSNQEIKDQAKVIVKRLEKVSSKRNEIIHSSWIAYSTGDFGQHRARSRGGKAPGLHDQTNNPNQMIDELVDKIDNLVFDLMCFEDEFIKDNP